MQPGWLKEYFQPRPDRGPRRRDRQAPTVEETQDGVSRRDFVKSGFVAGMTAGLAAGAVVAQTGSAQAQATPNPLARAHGGHRPGAPRTSAAPTTASRPPRCWRPRASSRPERSTRWGACSRRASRCSASGSARTWSSRARRPGALRQAQPLLPRRAVRGGDRAGGLAVRRPRPHRHGRERRQDPVLQRLHAGGGRLRLRSEEARHRASPAVLHPRHPARRARAQGRRSPADQLRHHGRRHPGDAGAPEHPRARRGRRRRSSTPATASSGRRTTPSSTRAAPAPASRRGGGSPSGRSRWSAPTRGRWRRCPARTRTCRSPATPSGSR